MSVALGKLKTVVLSTCCLNNFTVKLPILKDIISYIIVVMLRDLYYMLISLKI